MRGGTGRTPTPPPPSPSFQSTRPVWGGTPTGYTESSPSKAFQSTRPMRGGTAIIHKTDLVIYCTIYNYASVRAVLGGLFRRQRAIFAVRRVILRCEPAGAFMITPYSHSNHQNILRLISGLNAEMLNFCFIIISQVIKPQAVLFFIHK